MLAEKQRKAEEKRLRKAELVRKAMEDGDPFGSTLAQQVELDDDDEDEEESDEAIFREAGYYSVVESTEDTPPEAAADGACSSGAATPSWMSLAPAKQPDSVPSSKTLSSVQDIHRLTRANTVHCKC